MSTLGGKPRETWRKRHPAFSSAIQVPLVTLLVGYGAYGVLNDNITVPYSAGSRHHHTAVYLHFHGASAWLVFAGFACIGAGWLVALAWRGKGRFGKQPYVTIGIGLVLAGVAIVVGMVVLKRFGFV
jgi:hypothetical protein